MELLSRPVTSDKGIITEVLARNVYQKRKIGFEIEKDDYWLDLGGNIGSFYLFVLSVGGKVLIVEPEPENISMIMKNLKLNFTNFTEDHILPVAVDVN